MPMTSQMRKEASPLPNKPFHRIGGKMHPPPVHIQNLIEAERKLNKLILNMFCPKCRMEYREGFLVCSDCKAELVRELPPEEELEYVEFVEVLKLFNRAEIAFIKSLLDSEGIQYFFHGEHFSHLLASVEPTRLMVRKDQAETARELLRDQNTKDWMPD